MTTMYDSVDPFAIPADAAIVAGYVDGAYAWSAAGWARFPNARHVRITVTGSLAADVADVENGDLTPAQAAGWILASQADGLPVPTVYCSLNVLPAVEAACAGLTYDVWVASYDGLAGLRPGWAAKQYADPAIIAGHPNYDLSIAARWWPRGVPDMFTISSSNNSAVYCCDGFGKWHLDPAQLAALKAAGVPNLQVTSDGDDGMPLIDPATVYGLEQQIAAAVGRLQAPQVDAGAIAAALAADASFTQAIAHAVTLQLGKDLSAG